MKFYFVAFLTLFALQGHCQEEEKNNAFYTRIGIYEVSVGYQRQINEKIGLGIEIDYRPQFKKSSYNNIQWTSWSFSMEGYRVKPMINYYTKRNAYWSFFPSYRYLEAGELVYDPGQFGGSNTSDYAVYSQKNHEVGINAILNKPFKKHPAFEGYVGVGILTKFVERHYSIQGSYNDQQPSNEVTHPFYIVPAIYTGFKIKFARF